jgi:hypothetical protein
MLRMTRVFLFIFESHHCHTFASQKFLAGEPKRRQEGGMRTLPQNMCPSFFGAFRHYTNSIEIR